MKPFTTKIHKIEKPNIKYKFKDEGKNIVRSRKRGINNKQAAVLKWRSRKARRRLDKVNLDNSDA